MELKSFHGDSLVQMERFYRTNFVNSLSGFKSANLIGTRSVDGVNNLAIFTSAFHLGANPALVGMISRPDSVPRHTLENIRESGFFTVNAVTSEFFTEAHQSAANYPKDISEFEACGLNAQFIEDFQAPFVGESPLKIGLKLRQIIDLDINQTHLIIGEIVFVQLPEMAILEDGKIDLEVLEVACVSGLDTYHETRLLGRLAYAKPDQKPKFI